MNIIGQTVEHKKFGVGIVTDQQENKIFISFEQGQKQFLFPDAFLEYLQIKDQRMKNEIALLNEYRKIEKEKEKKIREQENGVLSRILTMKLPVKSQLVYHVKENEKDDLDYLDTGYILSGQSKGNIRKPINVQPNSAILLTDCWNQERYIWGIVMAAQFFWGKECTDGKIVLHHKQKIILTKENRSPIRNYFKEDTVPLEWGKIPYKYFDTQSMNDIIYDICCKAEDSEQEEDIKELYHYFCGVNRIPERSFDIE